MNPEAIVVHKPTALLRHVPIVVENRGVFMPETEPLVKWRRRRTVLITAKGAKVASLCDEVSAGKREREREENERAKSCRRRFCLGS